MAESSPYRTADIAADAKLQTVAAQMADLFPTLSTRGSNAVKVHLSIDASIPHPEGYRLEIDRERISIAAATPAGAFYGTVTLRQLVQHSRQPTGTITLPPLTIEDHPAFRLARNDAGCFAAFFHRR